MEQDYRLTYINKLYENINPMNFGNRLIFQKYVLNQIKDYKFTEEQLEELEDYLGDDFLYEDLIDIKEKHNDKFKHLVSNKDGELEDVFAEIKDKHEMEFQNKIFKSEKKIEEKYENLKNLKQTCLKIAFKTYLLCLTYIYLNKYIKT